jgi:hypothetical protein
MFFSWLITASGGDWPWQLPLQLLQLAQERRLSFDVVAPGPQAADVGDGVDIPSQYGDIMGIHYIYILYAYNLIIYIWIVYKQICNQAYYFNLNHFKCNLIIVSVSN